MGVIARLLGRIWHRQERQEAPIVGPSAAERPAGPSKRFDCIAPVWDRVQLCPGCGCKLEKRYHPGEKLYCTCGEYFRIADDGSTATITHGWRPPSDQNLPPAAAVSQGQAPSQIALEALRALGSVMRPHDAGEVREAGYYVYLVYNGPDVLQAGRGFGDRMNKCMRGARAGKHNKAFICAIGELVLGHPNKYAYVRMPSLDAAQEAEMRLHRALGINTNQQGATVIAGIEAHSIPEIHKALWSRVITTARYQLLDPIERTMAEELFELMTYGTTKITRRNKAVSSRQGDNLEGNILQKIGKRYLITIFQMLTNDYLRYKKHAISVAEFERAKASYSYIPRGEPFELLN